MSMQDPIADMLTRIRNAQMSSKADVEMPSSNLKVAISKVLVDEGFVVSQEIIGDEKKPVLRLELKYYEGKSVIEDIQRVSKPSLRVYRGAKEMPYVKKGLGVYIVSTEKGVMTDHQARNQGVGGEVICLVS